MIQSKELRIGNYVFDIDGDILQIGEILDVGVRFKNTSLASRYEKINPIPLTEEWLLKFGFEKEETGYWTIGKLRGGLTVCRAERKSDRLCYRWFVNNLKMTDLHFVHQLQNLYFALTGEELTKVSEGEK